MSYMVPAHRACDPLAGRVDSTSQNHKPQKQEAGGANRLRACMLARLRTSCAAASHGRGHL
ncbi:hypothetical protein CBM2623_A240071 [Cupriavidus taiwanensis]|nr:hypothetical protein CBM2608_A240068 [Cupriavidus taiwanensis]SPA27671.1 hypothetical protein CBM2623_A240071 [Cupriavidus taiwanensis]